MTEWFIQLLWSFNDTFLARRVCIDLSGPFFLTEEARKCEGGGGKFFFSEFFLFPCPLFFLPFSTPLSPFPTSSSSTFFRFHSLLSFSHFPFSLIFPHSFSNCMFVLLPYYLSLHFLLLLFIFWLSLSSLFITYPSFPCSLFSSTFLSYFSPPSFHIYYLMNE